MRRAVILGVLVAGFSGVAPAGAALDPCVKAISKAVGTYVPSRYKAIESCEDKRSNGKLAIGVNCRPSIGPVTDPKTDAKLTKAATKATTLITGACTGALPAIGTACDSNTTAATLAACLTAPAQDTDTEQLNADSLIATVYDATAPVDASLQKCQQTIGKESGKYLKARMNAALKCEGRFTTAKDPLAACPNAKTKAAADKARVKFDAGVRKFCIEAQLAANTAPKLDFGFPCESYKLVTFKRGPGNTNTVPVLDRFVGCMSDSVSGVGDRMVEIPFPGREDGAAVATFPQGVAAGDATDTAVIFWTRTSDTASGAVLDVSTGVTFATTVFSGAVPSAAGADGAIKKEVTGLTASTTYFYRWTQAAVHSRVGKVKTAPAPATAAPVHLGWSGDANAFFRPFTVIDPLRFANVDGWFFIGDTVYGDDTRSSGLDAHTLAEYQSKYVENRADRGLRDIMASAGTYVQWDDHEVRNDFAGAVPAFAARMANGNLAFRQYNPIRENGGDPNQLYRSFKWGSAAEFFLIDLRQYRSAKYTCCSAGTSGFVLTDDDSTCTGGGAGEAALPALVPGCSTALSGNDILSGQPRTVLGTAQKAWLKNALQNSTATFKFIMNGPPITALQFVPYDRWDGYPQERTELLDFIQDPNGDTNTTDHLKNVIFLSTDLHGIVVSHDQVDSTHLIPEVVSGAVGMDPIFRELPPSIVSFLPSLPTLLTQITEFDIDRFNVVTIDVDPAHTPTPEAVLHFFDRSGKEIHTVTFDAEP